MSMNSKVRKIKALKLAINREVARRDEALYKHGKDADKMFEALESLVCKVRKYFTHRHTERTLVLYKRLVEAEAAAKEVNK